jgi:uncharacterized protein (DUF952 family)
MDAFVFHIAIADDWAHATDSYVPGVFASEGFIHCSTRDQLQRVANTRYAGRADLVLLMIDARSLGASVRYENLSGGSELFPHVYSPVPREAVAAAEPLRPLGDGTFDAAIVNWLREHLHGGRAAD